MAGYDMLDQVRPG